MWASRHQVIILLGAYDIVDIGGSRTGARVRLANLRFVFFLPSVSRAEKHNLKSVLLKLFLFAEHADSTVFPEIKAYFLFIMLLKQVLIYSK